MKGGLDVDMRGIIITHLREIVFGMEDGLVSSLGAVSGIAAATKDPILVLVSGCIIILVESISMAAGTYLSDKTEFQQRRTSLLYRLNPRHQQTGEFQYATDGAISMGISYMAGGSLVLISYMLLPVNSALVTSIITTALILFLVGYIKAALTDVSRLRSGFETMFVSLAAAAVGLIIGNLGAGLTGK